MRLPTLIAVAASALAAAAALVIAPATPASATGFTHGTTLTGACTIHANYPKAGVPDWGWTKNPTSPTGTPYHLGVRYTYKGYVMVEDYARHTAPSWGWIPASCLTDPKAYDHGDHGNVLPDLKALGGHGMVKDVPITADHRGRRAVVTIHVGSHTVGSLRSAPRSFVIGNVHDGDPFQITTAHCGHHSAASWILGYAPQSGRWGYIEARHLPACL